MWKSLFGWKRFFIIDWWRIKLNLKIPERKKAYSSFAMAHESLKEQNEKENEIRKNISEKLFKLFLKDKGLE